VAIHCSSEGFQIRNVALKRADAIVKIRAIPAQLSVQVMKILGKMLIRPIKWNPSLDAKETELTRLAHIYRASSFEKLGTRCRMATDCQRICSSCSVHMGDDPASNHLFAPSRLLGVSHPELAHWQYPWGLQKIPFSCS